MVQLLTFAHSLRIELLHLAPALAPRQLAPILARQALAAEWPHASLARRVAGRARLHPTLLEGALHALAFSPHQSPPVLGVATQATAAVHTRQARVVALLAYPTRILVASTLASASIPHFHSQLCSRTTQALITCRSIASVAAEMAVTTERVEPVVVFAGLAFALVALEGPEVVLIAAYTLVKEIATAFEAGPIA